jgi:hypothetical protein
MVDHIYSVTELVRMEVGAFQVTAKPLGPEARTNP